VRFVKSASDEVFVSIIDTGDESNASSVTATSTNSYDAEARVSEPMVRHKMSCIGYPTTSSSASRGDSASDEQFLQLQYR